ncbi:conserved hypothetical protein [Shewanella sp. ANA-3]|uniref:hypothetical protein n=1 Tax=Shewanella sp. (strain ANA-3) TaxID=94122 RepID=UPI00005DED53|nr:hypothetical protein [Shewanella sp. ANA-3]ABK49827.1 conserved hypothetical protein [Shewanella sp. ANA-3]
MKYKNFKPLVHNFTHSFVGGCNYLDGKFIFEDLFELAEQRRGRKVVVQWLPFSEQQDPELSERVKSSIGFYLAWLPKMASSLGVELEKLTDYRTEVYVTLLRDICVKAIAHDDRGKEYSYIVSN